LGDVRKVIDYAGENLDVDLERVGMMGVSMGAIITLLAATAEERLKAIVSVIGGANFQVLVRKSSLSKIGLETKLVMKFAQSAGELIRKFDPINNAHLFRSIPVLLLNGERDDLIPLECASSLYEALKPYYQDAPDRLRM
jgi:dipeptidyl aminopeptidase/acylaminoacyl peptidase